MTVTPHDIARVLSEALPHMQRYDEEIVVVKYGGHAMGEEDAAARLRPRHRADGADRHQSGGRAWRRPADRRDAQAARHQVGIRRRPARHRRGHDRDRRDGAGRLDQQADRRLHQRRRRQGGRPFRQGRQHGAGRARSPAPWSIPIRRSRRSSISASSASPRRSIPTVLDQILGRDLIPVIAPIAASTDGETYNVNADTFAGAIAGALKAKRLLLLTDVPGVLDKSKKLIKELTADDARRLIADGTISGGMIPKVETCIDALEAGRRRRRHPRRPGAACGAARTLHRPRRRHADEAMSVCHAAAMGPEPHDDFTSVPRSAGLSKVCSEFLLELHGGLRARRRALSRRPARPDHGRGAAAADLGVPPRQPQHRGTRRRPISTGPTWS